MKFINRKQEMARLERLMKLSEAAVGVLWGRRRVGKTRLLLEWAHKHKGIYFTADESAPPVQRKYFSLALDQVLPGFSSVEYPDWTAFFFRLSREASLAGFKGPIVIDELPYLISGSPELPSILQKFIDHQAKESGLILVLCGSSQHMMQGAVLNADAPLYGRAHELMKLGPLSAGYIGEALGLSHPRECVESYAVWGGIPRYWELVKINGRMLLENINDLVLDPMGPLHEEPNRLLLEELPPALSLRPILDAIGLGAHRISEIATRLSIPATSLVRPIQRLRDLDLIEREVPFGTLEQTSKRALYKIKDPFLRFWFEIVAPRRSFFTQAPSSSRYTWLKKSLPSLYALTWEELCRSAVPLIMARGSDVMYGQASRYWHGQGPEWDILSESDDKKHVLVSEAKWTQKPVSQRWIEDTFSDMHKKGPPPTAHSAQILYVLFVPEKPKKLTLPKGCLIVDAEEVLSALREHP